MSNHPFDDDSEEEEKTFFQRYRMVIIGGVVLIGGVVAFASKMSGNKSTASSKPIEMTAVRIQLPPTPPPPPPPPPPPQQEVKEEKMVEQAPVNEPPPEAAPDSSPDLGTAIKGDGPPDGFGLSGRGGGKPGGRSGAANSKYGNYAYQLQTKISDAIRNHPNTRSASIRGLKVRVWADSTGRITRVKLAGSTGDTKADQALAGEALVGIQLQEPPPAGMPMPIVMRVNAKRPGN